MTNSCTLIRRPQVQATLAISRSTTYLREAQGLLPRPVKCGPRLVAWPSHEISAIAAAMVSGKSDEEIKALVTKLEGERTNAA